MRTLKDYVATYMGGTVLEIKAMNNPTAIKKAQRLASKKDAPLQLESVSIRKETTPPEVIYPA